MNARHVLIGCAGLAAAALVGALPATFLLFSVGGAYQAELETASSADRWAVPDAEMPMAAAPPMEEGSIGGLGGGRGEAKPSARAARDKGDAGGKAKEEFRQDADEAPVDDAEGDGDATARADGADGADPTRSWFPEAFLWAPRVETDADGLASVDVRVPDQLTTWRVLGLAHDRGGQQTGALHAFDSRLPVYVDPVVPGWLYVGDRVDLPVQVVNTTDAAIQARLSVTAEGAWSGGGDATVALGPLGSDVRTLPLVVSGPGRGRVRATLVAGDDRDAAEREVPILPAGRPIRSTSGGSLTSTRALRLAGPDGADPATQEVTVRVFPGPLAVLQVELERALAGASPPDPAYGFALASAVGDLAGKASVEVDGASLRKLQLVAWQRVAREARAPSAGVAADLLTGLQGVDGNELVDGLRPRLVQALIQGQRGDGTWARQDDAPLNQVLVQTAIAARALPEDQVGAKLRAAGAFERYAREIVDPYTAAVVLASGAVDEALGEKLAALVIEGAITNPDGSRSVAVPANARNASGVVPSRAEVLAWTALALADRGVPWTGDLVAELMAGYDARWGFGAGRADALALAAVSKLLPGTSEPVEVALVRDGVEVARATVDPAQPKVPAVLEAAAGGDLDGWELRLAHDVPGLVFVAGLSSWVPWTGEERLPGVEVQVQPSSLGVGADGVIVLTMSAPSRTSLVVEQGLPAGAAVDDGALADLVATGVLVAAEVETDRVRLTTRPFGAGEVLEVPLRVRPGFGGRFHTVPLTVEADGRRIELPPMVWDVRATGAGA